MALKPRPPAAQKKTRKSARQTAASFLGKRPLWQAEEMQAIGFWDALLPQDQILHSLLEHPPASSLSPGASVLHRFRNVNASNLAQTTLPATDEAPETADPDERQMELEKLQKRVDPVVKLIRRSDARYFELFRFKARPRLALLHLNGAIHLGNAGQNPRADSIQALGLLPVLADIANSDCEAVFIIINSPGGSATASEILYQEIRNLARQKPVFALVQSVAASGGYYLACAATQIYASPLSLLGSIGVIRL
ncbi:MAG: S49 family peptidase, partial [Leptospiraceae bacterium]|nr:S49 family peptidase [Leptospiraceae bacterium]